MILYLFDSLIKFLKKQLLLLVCIAICQNANSQTNQNESCVDLEYQKLYSILSDSIFVESINPCQSGATLVGKICKLNSSPQTGFIMQLDSEDKVSWAKQYLDASGSGQVLFSKSEKVTGGILIIGRVFNSGPSMPIKTLIAKIDLLGNIVWLKEVLFNASIYPNAELQIQTIKEGYSGDLILSGSIYIQGFDNSDREGFVAKLNSNGAVQFIRSFAAKNTNINDCFGIEITTSKIMIFGQVEDGLCSSLDPRSIYEMTIDYNIGSIININRYCLPDISGNSSFPDYRHNWTFAKTKIGFQVGGFLRASPTANNFVFINFDSSGKFVNCFQVQDPNLANGYHNILFSNNSNVLIQSAHADQGAFQSQYSSTGMLISQVYYPIEGLYSKDLLSEVGNLAIENNSIVKYVLPCKMPIPSIKLFRRNLIPHLTKFCVGMDSAYNQASSVVVLNSNIIDWNKITDNPFSLISASFSVSDLAILEENICDDTLINSQLKITGPAEICPGQVDIFFYGAQLPGSYKKISWLYDSTWMQNLTVINDSTVKITTQKSLPQMELNYLHAEIEGCEFVRDSVAVRISSNTQDSVLLPADTTICPKFALTLKTTGKFRSYLWQNGSEDSVFIATSAGLYSLTAENYCGVSSSDTMRIRVELNCTSGIYFPNVFSPNGDGFNDIFRPIVRTQISNYNLQIFNRFGQLLFESHSTGMGWDGTFHHQMQNQDTYVWCAHYVINGTTEDKCNTLVLIH